MGREDVPEHTGGGYLAESGVPAAFLRGRKKAGLRIFRRSVVFLNGKPYIVTTIRLDLNSRLRNILKEKFDLEEPIQSGVRISLISGFMMALYT